MDEHRHSEALPPPSGEGTVLLDVGGTRGALVIFTTELMDGKEIEIRPTGSPWGGTHTAVRQRNLRDSVAFAGVFGSLPEGGYQLRIKGGSRGSGSPGTVDLTVSGGEITEVSWPQ